MNYVKSPLRAAERITTYTVEPATEYGTGTGINGYGKRVKVFGFYVIDPQGRRCQAFTGKNAEQKAIDWVKFCEENLTREGRADAATAEQSAINHDKECEQAALAVLREKKRLVKRRSGGDLPLFSTAEEKKEGRLL